MDNIMIANVIFVTASVVGLAKILPSIRKLLIVEYSDAHSLVHNETHVILLSLVIIGYLLVGTTYGFIFGFIELLSRLFLLN